MLTCVGVFLGLTMGMNLAYSTSIEIVVEGQLALDDDDWSYNLKGAQIEICYMADSTDTPTEIESFSGGITSVFDVFLMTVNVTNRPGGADDLLNLSNVTNDPMACNFFNGRNDEFWFDSRPFPVPSEGMELDVGGWGMDFGSQDFFPGTGPVADLSFLLGLEQNWTFAQDSVLGVGVDNYVQYSINNLTVSIIPEPATMLLLGLGGMFLRSRKF
jgi:hypothetical protein